MTDDTRFIVYGEPLSGAATVPSDALQVCPVAPGSRALEDIEPATLTGFVMAAPPGTLERRYALALALRALQPGAPITVMAPKTKGGQRLAKELEAFGCEVETESLRHQRICRARRPATLRAVTEAIAAGGLQFMSNIDLWTQPGIFSWDRVDEGTALLISALPPLEGRGADLGCGLGLIARAVLASEKLRALALVDIDRRAIAAVRENVSDPRADFHWSDARSFGEAASFDFVVMNPPFHDGGLEDRALGESFIRAAHRILRAGGTAWLVANRHLPYESILRALFAEVVLRAEKDGFKVYEATR